MKLACFALTLDEIYALMIAVRSLARLDINKKEIVVVIPETLRVEFEEKHPETPLNEIFKKLGANYNEAFKSGLNQNASFRQALGNVLRRFDEDGGIVFAPRMIFWKDPREGLGDAKHFMIQASDGFWPEKQLYGPSISEMWKAVLKLGERDCEDLEDTSFPKEYWARYPFASEAFIATHDAEAYAERYNAISREFIEKTPEALEGQSREYVEATVTATAHALGAERVNLKWDEAFIFYRSFLGLRLRTNASQYEILRKEILDYSPLRKFFKSVPLLREVFYGKFVESIKSEFSEVEQGFSILRMETLIERRKIMRSIEGRIRRRDKNEKEAKKNSGEDIDVNSAEKDEDM